MGRTKKTNAVKISELGAEDNLDRDRIPELLPVLPIRDAVYFPHQMFPLFLGREKSINALDDAMEGNRLVLLVAQKSVEIDDPGTDDIYRTGVVAEVMQVLRVPDGTVRVTLEAFKRAKIVDFIATEPFFKARTRILQESSGDDSASEAAMRNVVGLFERVVESQAPGTTPYIIAPELLVKVVATDNPGKVADLITPNLPIRVHIKQDLLETTDPMVRLEKLYVVLSKELEVIDIQRNIRDKVEKEMGDTQREYILREQLKAIRQELGGKGNETSEADEYREKIKASGMPEETMKRAYKEVEKLERTPTNSPESTVLLNYLDWLLAMPWDKSTQDRIDIAEAEELLEKEHFGLKKVKERIIEYLSVRKLQPGLKGPILCFVGPPGVGKTSIGKSIAESLGRKFHRLSLGGVRDEAEIRGHRRTYVGALPGRIVQGIKLVESNNPVFMLDEIDKMDRGMRGDPASALLEALDPEQNHAFTDHYLEVPFDLRNVMFITTANMLDEIPSALRDRMEVITFSGYIEEEKLQIAKRFLVPKQITENGLTPEHITINDSALRHIIREYTREAGVRELERLIASICRKVATRVAKGKTVRSRVGQSSVARYLGRKKYFYERAEEKDRVAVATALVYTGYGGDITPVEAVPMKSLKGQLVLTGQLGDIMKESGQAAMTYVRSRAARLGLDEMFYNSTDMHVHVPAGAVPKDGPSAGITLAAAIASALTGWPVRGDVAMTGEITLTGRVLQVGGIREKVLAAHRAGIRTVVLPASNEADLDDLPQYVKAQMTFKLISHADEMLDFVLLNSTT